MTVTESALGRVSPPLRVRRKSFCETAGSRIARAGDLTQHSDRCGGGRVGSAQFSAVRDIFIRGG